jgi:hypothetical protein
MTGLTPDEKRRLHDLAEQIAEIAEHHEGRWKVQTTDGMILVAMVSPTAPHGLNVVRLRRQIEAQAPGVIALNDTNMHDPVSGLTKIPDLMVITEQDADDTAKVVDARDVLILVNKARQQSRAPPTPPAMASPTSGPFRPPTATSASTRAAAPHTAHRQSWAPEAGTCSALSAEPDPAPPPREGPIG